jgi:hypothetical protein
METTTIIFEVVGRSKTEKLDRKGNKTTIYKILLKSVDAMNRLELSDTNSTIIEKYPLKSTIAVKIGNNPQTNLITE